MTNYETQSQGSIARTIHYTVHIDGTEYSGTITASNRTWNDRVERAYAAWDLEDRLSLEEWAALNVTEIETEVGDR